MISKVLPVLMWKHGVVRLRRFIQTIVEIGSVVVFFAIMYTQRKELTTSYPDEARNPVANTDVMPLTETMVPPHWILYYPDTPLTESLMNDVGPKLDLKRLTHFPDSTSNGYFPYSNATDLTDLVSKMSARDAIVIFHKMTGESWPDSLNYTIRMKDVFKTETYKSTDSKPGPHRMFGLDYGTFMRIQWAIDTSYIKLLTGTEVPVTVALQEFPYYHNPENTSAFEICFLLMLICLVSPMLPFVFLMCRLMQERAGGIQELMKMLGVSVNTLWLSHILNVMPTGLIFSIVGSVLVKVSEFTLIPNSNGLLLFVAYMLHFNTIVAQAFACSYVARNAQYAASGSVLAYVLLWLPSRLVFAEYPEYNVALAAGFLPHMPMYWFWEEITELELYGKGLTFSNMMTSHAVDIPSVFTCYMFMLIQIFISYLLAWYLSLVRPGEYGQALPWNFIFQPQYWSKNEIKPESETEEGEPIAKDPRYFESMPANMEVGIKVINVSKLYPRQRALRNVSLEVYKGEITVLVGRNGAGKTTLMSIITGMTSATEGKVYINGKDTVAERNAVRQNLGFCPQHNLFFPDLDVGEHIVFFTVLKGGTYAQARASARQLADSLGLGDKLSTPCQRLSGGMRRRVQLACALAGRADVLVLDEPTSGLDVETRRELWNLLLSLRGERTVLLTTHFMEEVDALGDRVAALHAGELRCFATTMHLKKAVGTGYRLSLTTVSTPKEADITSVVTSHVPEATVKEKKFNSISYNLPATASKRFSGLFTALESKKSSLGIETIGVGVSTLEEVFMKLCSDVETTIAEDEVDQSRRYDNDTPPSTIKGLPLFVRQMLVLLRRQVKYTVHKKWAFIILQVILPITMIFGTTHMMNNAGAARAEALALHLDVYGERSDRRVLLRLPHDAPRAALTRRYPGVRFEDTDDVAEHILQVAEKNILDYNRYLVGVELNDTDAKVLYTTTVRHAAPVALNLLSNVLAARQLPWAAGRAITAVNEPLRSDERLAEAKHPKLLSSTFTWAMTVTFVILATNVNSVTLVCMEGKGARHIHVMSGCAAELHWAATLIFHVTQCFVTLIIPTIIAVIALERDNTTNQPEMLMTYFLILLLGSTTFFAFMYNVSYHFGEKTTSFVLVTIVIVTGFFTPYTVAMFELTSEALDSSVGFLVYPARALAPPHTMMEAVVKCVHVAYLKAWCEHLRPRCPNINLNDRAFDAKQCCVGEMRCYFCGDDYSPDTYIYILCVQFLVLMTMVILTERGIFTGVLNKIANSNYKAAQPPPPDDYVRKENEYVAQTFELPTKQIPDALLVDNIHKNYVSYKKSLNAVKGLSFSVKKGECFGLLGVNGAGKTATFKILTAEDMATSGRVYGNGYYLKRGNSQYLQTLGYCPQFFCLDSFLTGEENLALLLNLKGVESSRVRQEVKSWIEIVGLQKYAQQPVSTYSGGCARRLGAAAALCTGAPLTLLDEPSAGVDVAARRQLWAALRRGLARDRAIIITSHSMDEMEALCSRIGILSKGSLRALGTPAGLRALHAHGHAVVFKVAPDATGDEVDGAKTKINQLKEKLQGTFNCTLKDEHKTMLHYQINDTMRYSDLFLKLEAVKAQYPTLIQDYSATETTLEEVFLYIAKEQQPVPETA